MYNISKLSIRLLRGSDAFVIRNDFRCRICEPFRDIFKGIRQTKGMRKTEHPKKPKKVFGHDIGGSQGFNYMDDYDAWK